LVLLRHTSFRHVFLYFGFSFAMFSTLLNSSLFCFSWRVSIQFVSPSRHFANLAPLCKALKLCYMLTRFVCF
jgi:hypothetical protein